MWIQKLFLSVSMFCECDILNISRHLHFCDKQVGPDWMCMCVTYSLILVPTVLFIIYIAEAISIVLTIIASISLAVLLACFSYAACSDPGVVYHDHIVPTLDPEHDGAEMRTNKKYNNAATIECSQCNMMRPCTAMHCYECGVCIEEVSDCSVQLHFFSLP
jgi:hypothetical protein